MPNATTLGSRKKSPTTPAKPRTTKPPKCRHCLGVNGKHQETCPDNRCSECRSMTTIGHLIDCSKHPNHRPKERTAAAAAAPARAEAAARKTESAPAGTFFPVDLLDGALDALQRSFNDGDFAGDTQKQHQCEYEQPDGHGGVVKCSNIAALKKVVTNHCEACERNRKETKLRLCIPHAINVWGGNAPARLQTEMDLT